MSKVKKKKKRESFKIVEERRGVYKIDVDDLGSIMYTGKAYDE